MGITVDTVEVKTYKVAGLTCIDCAGRIQASVSQLDGVDKCAVDHNTGDLTVWLSNPEFDIARVSKIVKNTGHTLITESSQNAHKHAILRIICFPQ